MLFKVLCALSEKGLTDGLAEKIDIFFAAGKISREEYEELSGLLG